MVGLAIVIIIVGIIVWILLTPIILRIDTRNNIYDLRLKGIVHTYVDWKSGTPTFHAKLPIYHYQNQLSLARPSVKNKKKKSAVRHKPRIRLSQIKNVIRSFSLSKLAVSLDTDNYVLNAQLIPIGVFLSQNGFPLTINFEGNTYLLLEIRNTFWRLIIAFLGLKKY